MEPRYDEDNTHTLNMFADHWEDPEGFESRFRDNPHGEFMSNWSITDKEGNPVDIRTGN
jgi:hypothetical protein